MKVTWILIFLLVYTFSHAQNKFEVWIKVSADEKLSEDFSQEGRLIVFFSRKGNQAPVYQGTFSPGKIGFAKNETKRNNPEIIEINKENCFNSSETTLDKIEEGKWFIQAVYNISGNPDFHSERNLISTVFEKELTQNDTIKLQLSETIKPRRNSEATNSKMVKYIELESRLLTDFWGKPMKIKASVLLPRKFDKNNNKKYPVRLNIGGYGSSWTRASRLEQDSDFMKWWLSDEAPELINIFPDGDGPFGDPYYIDSDNSGPYGSALTQELIPFIEKQFNGIGKPEFRFVDGCSTGGWVSFALQVFYPDYFNGAWSYSADPVDFHHMQLVDMYDDSNAFYNQYGYLNPSMRTETGQPILSIKEEVAGENIRSFENSYTTSCEQWGSWNALYSSKGKDGLPEAAFDPVTGKIDKKVTEHWKKYDLLEILKNNWAELGPKLQGKLWIWMGDMDNFYLNNAMREMDTFLKSTVNPVSDAHVTFEPVKGHCDGYSHRKVLELIQKKIDTLNTGN